MGQPQANLLAASTIREGQLDAILEAVEAVDENTGVSATASRDQALLDSTLARFRAA